MGKNEKAIKKLRVEFLPEALEIVEKPTAPLGNIIIWFVFLLIVLFLLWACFGKIDEVATARGQIVSEDGVQELQAAGNGIVTEVMVREGDTVHKGDVLYRMDKEVEKKKIDYSEDNIGLIELRIELFNQLINGKDITEYRTGSYSKEQKEIIEYMISLGKSDELSIKEYETAVQIAKSQYEIAKLGLKGVEDEKDYLKSEKALQKQSAELGSTASLELELLESNYEYASAEAEKYKKLYEAGAKSKADWKEKVQELDNIETQINIKKIEIENEKLSQTNDNSSVNYQISQNNAEYQNQQGNINLQKSNYDTALVNLENAKTQRNAKLYEMKDKCVEELKGYGVTVSEQYYEYENKDIVALYDGVIKSLNVDKEGAVVTATQVVAEMLPDSAQMLVEAEVKNSDIGFVEVGQEVDIKIDTYDYQKYGKLHGTVVYISPDAIENEKMEKVYKAGILLNMDEIKDTMDISQGMECSVEIKTDRRRIIEFFLEPLTEALDNSLNVR